MGDALLKVLENKEKGNKFLSDLMLKDQLAVLEKHAGN